jgi:hypothetical protein
MTQIGAKEQEILYHQQSIEMKKAHFDEKTSKFEIQKYEARIIELE